MRHGRAFRQASNFSGHSHVSRLPSHDSKGLTLVEVLISVALLAAGSVLVLQALAKGAHVLASARCRAAAHAFASAKLADIELAARQGALPAKTSGTFRQSGAEFDWAIQAAPTGDTPFLETVTLTVGWRQGPHRYEQRVTTVKRAPEPAEPPA